MITPHSQSTAARPEAPETLPQSLGEENTVLHDSLMPCAYCGKPFTPRVRSGPNASRFCQPEHKDAWHNRQRRANGNPPAAATYQVTVTVPYRGQILVLDRATFDEAARRGQELAAACPVDVDTGYLDVWEVIAAVGYCRSGIYALINRGQFPAPTVLSAPGRQRKVAWRAAGVADWLRRRSKTKARTAEGRPGFKKSTKHRLKDGAKHGTKSV